MSPLPNPLPDYALALLDPVPRPNADTDPQIERPDQVTADTMTDIREEK